MTRTIEPTGYFDETKKRSSRFDRKSGKWEKFALRWAWGDNGDNTYYAVVTNDRNEIAGNFHLFPEEWEARHFAESCSQGFLETGALMNLMTERVARARAR